METIPLVEPITAMEPIPVLIQFQQFQFHLVWTQDQLQFQLQKKWSYNTSSLSCKFEGYGKFCSCKNITKCSLFEVENPCLCSFLGKFLHSLKRANPTTTAELTIHCFCNGSFSLIMLVSVRGNLAPYSGTRTVPNLSPSHFLPPSQQPTSSFLHSSYQ